MRFLVYFAPLQTSKRIDTEDGTTVQDVIEILRKEFKIRVSDDDDEQKSSIILNYNGADLKPTWLINDVNIAPGAIIHCSHRDIKPADLYVHCEFNKQILEIFDSTITADSTISDIRVKIADKLGIPLSTFCLEMYHYERRLFDSMKMFQYDLKPGSHVFLKVLYGFGKFIKSCTNGFAKYRAHDELTRNYEAQIALHIASFYGYLGLAETAFSRGARSDCSVGEHPSKQWFFEETVQQIPEMLKCPFHVAVERGHMKIIDLCVRQSILCTQVIHPITSLLPYRMALSLVVAAKARVDKLKYGQIYLYLQDKQFNFKVPLNADGNWVSKLLKMNPNTASFYRQPKNLIYFSLPRYCKIIRWYERAKERVWKKHGLCIERSTDIRRSHHSRGMLGYKVSIDGFKSVNREKNTNYNHRLILYSEDERNQLAVMEAHMKKVTVGSKKRGKYIEPNSRLRARRERSLTQQASFGGSAKNIGFAPANSSVTNENTGSIEGSTFAEDSSIFFDHTNQIANATVVDEYDYLRTLKVNKNQASGFPQILTASKVKEQDRTRNHRAESSSSTISCNYQDSKMSSADAYAISSARINGEKHHKRILTDRERIEKIKASFLELTEQTTTKPAPAVVKEEVHKVRQLGPVLPLPERKKVDLSPVRSRYDNLVQQKTIESYKRHTNDTSWDIALNCLDEAVCLNGKPWAQKVDLGKSMIKQRTKRSIHANNQMKINFILSSM